MNNPDDEEEDINLSICACARAIELYYLKYIHKNPCMDSSQTGNIWLMELLQGNDRRCYTMLRMDKDVFYKLSIELQSNYGLKGSRNMNSIEILGMFVHMLGHGVGNRLAQERFQHSGETVSRYFSYMLDVVCRMAMDVIKPMDREFSDIPQAILRDSRYMPHFKVKIASITSLYFLLLIIVIHIENFVQLSFLGLYWCYKWSACLSLITTSRPSTLYW